MKIGVSGLGRLGSRHAALLAAHPEVSELVITTCDTHHAERTATDLGASVARTEADLLASDLDGLAVASASAVRRGLLERAVAAGVTTFCETLVACELRRSQELLCRVAVTGVAVQVGFQRRFDRGYVAARRALRNGLLGDLRRVHVVSADPLPPPTGLRQTSGGIFRDLVVPDIDAVRWVTGREVAEVYATGANRGSHYFGEAGDVDECTALLTLDDGTLVTSQASRHNGGGYDVRMELAGTEATYVVGLSERSAIRSAEPGVRFPNGEPWEWHWDRFELSYAAEINSFIDLVAGRGRNFCSIEESVQALVVADALEQSRREYRPVSVQTSSRHTAGSGRAE